MVAGHVSGRSAATAPTWVPVLAGGGGGFQRCPRLRRGQPSISILRRSSGSTSGAASGSSSSRRRPAFSAIADLRSDAYHLRREHHLREQRGHCTAFVTLNAVTKRSAFNIKTGLQPAFQREHVFEDARACARRLGSERYHPKAQKAECAVETLPILRQALSLISRDVYELNAGRKPVRRSTHARRYQSRIFRNQQARIRALKVIPQARFTYRRPSRNMNGFACAVAPSPRTNPTCRTRNKGRIPPAAPATESRTTFASAFGTEAFADHADFERDESAKKTPDAVYFQ